MRRPAPEVARSNHARSHAIGVARLEGMMREVSLMRDGEKWKKRAAAGLLGLLVFCAGILVGQVGQPTRTEEAVAAFAAATEDAALPNPSETPPAPSPENWFAMETVNGEEEVTPAPLGGVSEPTPAPDATGEPSFRIELVRDATETSVAQEGRAKRVLIYHTHTYEAYEQMEADPYKETQQWRTEDGKHNVVRVGEELAALLRSAGIEVVHDISAFEPPDLNTAYTRSLEMLEKRRDMDEAYDLYIDVHRDAYVASQGGANTVAVGDHSVAKLMVLIGKGEGQTTEGLGEKPAWEENFAFAQKVTSELNAELPGICKDICVKSGRFNQHIAAGKCVLIEVGNNKNTLAEAKAAMPYLADAIRAALASAN